VWSKHGRSQTVGGRALASILVAVVAVAATLVVSVWAIAAASVVGAIVARACIRSSLLGFGLAPSLKGVPHVAVLSYS